MKLKKANSPIQWKKFEIEREYLFKNPSVQIEIGIFADVDNPNGWFRNLDLRSRDSGYRKLKKKIDKIHTDFEKLEKLPGFYKKEVQKHLDIVKSAFDFAVKSLDDAKIEHPSADVLKPGKRGPKPYPGFLAKWIYELIDSAKNNGEHLEILINFFKPNGEFDTWLKKSSSGFWQGPRKKDNSKNEFSSTYNENDLKWLNDFKNSQLKNIDSN